MLLIRFTADMPGTVIAVGALDTRWAVALVLLALLTDAIVQVLRYLGATDSRSTRDEELLETAGLVFVASQQLRGAVLAGRATEAVGALVVAPTLADTATRPRIGDPSEAAPRRGDRPRDCGRASAPPRGRARRGRGRRVRRAAAGARSRHERSGAGR